MFLYNYCLKTLISSYTRYVKISIVYTAFLINLMIETLLFSIKHTTRVQTFAW